MLKVFIIDDEKLIREGLSDYIDWAKLGLEVVGSSGDGQEGFQKILKLLPDIVISDIRLPSLSGIELLKKLRQKNLLCPVILISAYSDFQYAQEAVRYGAFDYILKPIEENALVEAVCRCKKQISQYSIEKNAVESPMKSIIADDSAGEQEPANVRDYKERLIEPAIDYIKKNYSHDIYLEQVAHISNLSVSHFSVIFKDVTGKNFSQYLCKLRMEKAKDMIRNPQNKIYEICNMVGYTDLSHFSKKFKDYWGYSPIHFR